MLTIHDLRSLASRAAGGERIGAEFPLEAYGNPAHERAWCFTDVLRAEPKVRTRLIDALTGAKNGKGNSDPERRSKARVRLLTLTKEPATVQRTIPVGEPVSATGHGSVQFEGVAHHSPRQWEVVDYEYPADAVYTWYDPDGICTDSAKWLLEQHGYLCRGSGKATKRVKGGWLFVEQAFLDLHPTMNPFTGGSPKDVIREKRAPKVLGSEHVTTPKRRGATAEATAA